MVKNIIFLFVTGAAITLFAGHLADKDLCMNIGKETYCEAK